MMMTKRCAYRIVVGAALSGLFAIGNAGCASGPLAARSVAPFPARALAQPNGLYLPGPGTMWQWQLSTPPKVYPMDDTQMYDIDMFDNTSATVAALHKSGGAVVCYIDAGTWENWRPDAGKFPASVLGEQNGWPGERWLDIRQLSILGPIMEARLDLCKSKAFDGVEFDNVDGYQNDSGFPLSANDQLAYNTFLAAQAHQRGLSAALKNDGDQVAQLLPDFDYAVVEQCFQYGDCSLYVPFIKAGKAVFETEYSLSVSQFCPAARKLQFSAMRKNLSLDRWRNPCWP